MSSTVGVTPLGGTAAEQEDHPPVAGGGAVDQSKQQLALLYRGVSLEGRRPDSKALTAALAGNGGVPADLEGWKLACELLEGLVAYFPAEPALWSEVMNKLIARICALDVQLSPAVFAAVQKAVKLFHTLLHGAHPRKANKKKRGKQAVLSHYDMITELRHFVGGPQDRGGSHWTLETFQNVLRIRKHNLSALLSVTGSAERCRMFGVHQAEETAIFYKVPPKHRMVDEKTLSSPRTTFVYSLLQMIVHRAPMDIIKAQIAPGDSASSGSATPASAGGGASAGTASSQLAEAAVFRVCQLLETEQPRGDMSNMNVEQFCDMWWGQWQNFSEELYAFVEDGLIDFGQFIISLGKSQRQSTPGRIKDNVVIWLIAQCLPLDNVKKLFVHDLTSNHGRLFLRMFEFHNSQQADVSGFELRDTALHCLIFRLYNARDTGRTDLKSYLPAQLQPLYERGTKAVLQYRQWWNETEKNGENLDFYNLAWTKLWHVCLLSNFTSSPISGAFFDAMNKPLEPVQQCYLPGQLVFRGRSQPIPTMNLFLLSTRTRQRLLDLLEAHILRPRQTQADPYNNPAIVGTYSRLLYTAPYSRNRFRLLKNLMSSEPTVLHVLIELLNFRLLRFFRYHSSIRHLYLHLHEVAMTTTQHVLFHSLENLLFKLSLNLEEVIKFSKATNVINFGQSLNRALILGLARQIKCRGVSSFSQFRQLPLLLSRLLATTRHNWSDATLKFFPEVMRSFFQQNQKPDPEAYTNKETVYHEFQAQEALLRGALGEDNPYSMNYLEHAPDACVQRLNEYYSSNMHPRKLFLSLIWILLRERDSSHAHNVLRVLQQFTPQDVTACNFALVDFVLDTLQPQQLMFLPEPASPDLINQTGGLLAKMIWQYSIVRFEIVLQALMDRDDDANAFPMIDYLLNQSPEFFTRVEFWSSLGVRPDHWREQAYFTYHRQFHDKFPELLAMPGGSALPTYYGNVCLRALPVLDVLLGRLIENEQLHLLERIVTRYGGLWRYHDTPITFTCDLLQYYHESENISANLWKLNLLSILKGVTPKFSASFKEFSLTKNVELVSTDAYFHSTVDHVADFLTTELPSNSKFHTTATLQIFEEFSNVCQETVTTTMLELLLLPFSASDVTNKLLDIALGPQAPPAAQPSTNSTSSSALDSMMQVDVASPTTAMFELLGSMDAGPSSVPFSAVTGSAPTTTAFAAATTPSNPPSFSQISAVALLLTSLPSHFHTPIYERAMLLFKQHPLLAPTPMDEELPPGAGPFSCYSFTDYTSNVSSMLDNLPNRGLCLMHNFFLYGTVENFAIYPNFIRALAPTSIQQVYLACKLIAPFIYRINSKPELSVEIIIELYKSLASVLNQSTAGTWTLGQGVPLDLLDPMNYLDTITDFLIHAVAVYEGPTDVLLPSLRQVVATMSPQMQAILQSTLLRPVQPSASVTTAVTPGP